MQIRKHFVYQLQVILLTSLLYKETEKINYHIFIIFFIYIIRITVYLVTTLLAGKS